MNSMIFLKRIFTNKIYWLSAMAAILLLFCSEIYVDTFTGGSYTFWSLFYDETMRKMVANGSISMQNILLGYDNSYLWMFCPIIVSIPCVLINKTERFVLFRSSKTKYSLSKYFLSVFSGGFILVIAYMVYSVIWMVFAGESMWDLMFLRKIFSVLLWGIISTIPGVVLTEFVQNKYLILCIPFVLNYFMYMFIGNFIERSIYTYINPSTYQILFLYDKHTIIIGVSIIMLLLVIGAVFKRFMMERRCDCGR